MALRPVTLAPLGVFYLVETQGKEGSYFKETRYLTRGKDQTMADAISALDDADDIAIYEVHDGKIYDVSREVAEAWMLNLADTFDPHRDDWPAFIQRHVSPLRLEEIEADVLSGAANAASHRRSFAQAGD